MHHFAPPLMLALKASAVWLLILVCAVINGAFREGFLLPHFGLAIAFVFSGLLLSLCIVVVAVLLVPWFGQLDASHYFLIGTFWVGLTLIFEFGFGRLAQQKTWTQLLDAYTFRDGNLWPLVVLVIAFAPWLAARLRGWLARVAK